MRFHGLMLVRDEEDIIVENLTHLLTWADAIYILDLGSTDSTWDIIQDFAKRDARVIPHFSRPIIYTDALRSMLFDHYRGGFDEGDWVIKVDADEFYHHSPPAFARERLRRSETAVYLQWYFFRLTEGEADDYESGRVDVLEDRLQPIAQRRRFYKVSQYSEPRMFKYRRTMQWPENISFPFNAGYVARERIPIRHYPHRDTIQMRRRYHLRSEMMKLGGVTGDHWRMEDWRQELVDDAGISPALRKSGGGLAGERGIDTGPLLHWKRDTPLAEVHLHGHLPPLTKRLSQRIIHPALLPPLDSRRPRYRKAYEPPPIPPHAIARLTAGQRELLGTGTPPV